MAEQPQLDGSCRQACGLLHACCSSSLGRWQSPRAQIFDAAFALACCCKQRAPSAVATLLRAGGGSGRLLSRSSWPDCLRPWTTTSSEQGMQQRHRTYSLQSHALQKPCALHNTLHDHVMLASMWTNSTLGSQHAGMRGARLRSTQSAAAASSARAERTTWLHVLTC